MAAKFKFGVKQIVLLVVSVLVAGIFIAGNIVLDTYKLVLNKLFVAIQYESEAGGEAFALGDALVPQLVEDSVVLLRNEDNTLPLDATNDKENKVNLFGWNATTNGFLLTGAGSGGSKVLDENRVTLAEAFEKAGYEYNTELYDAYRTGSSAGGDTINMAGQFASTVMNVIHNPGASFYTDAVKTQALNYSDVAIIVLSRNTGENCETGETLNFGNYSNGAWLELTANEKLMLEKVTDWFKDGKVIVLLNTSNTMELGFLEEYDVDAAMYIGPVGQSGATAIPYLLYGQKKVTNVLDGSEEIVKISPSGRTSDTYAYNYNLVEGRSYSPSWSSAISNSASIYYQEGVYIGYKWYETADAEGFFNGVITDYGSGYNGIVQYPFGYGKSYTTFKWEVEEWPTENKLAEDGEYTVKVRVTNTGTHPGKDVVELYYTPPYIDGEIEKAEMNLLAFAKTVSLEPGLSQVVTLKFSAYDLASYDDYDKNDNGFSGYELDRGNHVIKLMTDAHHAATCFNDLDREVSNSFTFGCDGILFETDPVTGTEVTNQFTGTDAWDGTPIDGSTAFNGGIDYLSRAGQFENFPTATTFTCKPRNSSPDQEYKTTAWNNMDISDIQYGQKNGMYLVTKADGTQASSSDLTSAGADLAYNVELMTTLHDYDADEWTDFLNQLTDTDIKNLIGKGQFQTVALESVGKPFCTELDGPGGFNRNSVSGAPMDARWVVFPAEILLGCSWNPQSTYSMGKAMGVIAMSTTVHGWYGPGLNLHRSPYYGRNFEYYSEDAVLTGKLAAECIRGAKENNLTCYMKHFVAADTGPNSRNWYTWMTEQNLRENYLRPFEIAVKEGGANAAMSGFSAIGATWAGSNWAVSTQVLRNEWGFRGTVITDWYNNYMNPIRGILGGNDLWLGAATVNFSTTNKAEAYCARQSAKNILYTYVDCYMTAYEYNMKLANGEIEDPYAVNVDKPMVGDGSTSSLFVFLWVLIDFVLVAGLAVSILFMFISPKKKGAAVATATAGEGETSIETTETTETAETITCPHCGEQLPAGAKFCGKCGNPIDKE